MDHINSVLFICLQSYRTTTISVIANSVSLSDFITQLEKMLPSAYPPVSNEMKDLPGTPNSPNRYPKTKWSFPTRCFVHSAETRNLNQRSHCVTPNRNCFLLVYGFHILQSDVSVLIQVTETSLSHLKTMSSISITLPCSCFFIYIPETTEVK